MISIKDACKKAKQKSHGFDLLETRETEKMWIFIFGKVDNDGKHYPGAPNIAVEKESGDINYLTVPPIKNLQLINEAKIVDTY